MFWNGGKLTQRQQHLGQLHQKKTHIETKINLEKAEPLTETSVLSFKTFITRINIQTYTRMKQH